MAESGPSKIGNSAGSHSSLDQVKRHIPLAGGDDIVQRHEDVEAPMTVLSTHQLRSESVKTRPRIFPREPPAPSAGSLQGELHRIRQLQRLIGNRHVARLIEARRLLPNGKMIDLQTPIALQRAACEYQSGEKATGIARGILGTDVQLIPATGSGYDAAPTSVVIADFRPESAVVRTSTAEELRRGGWIDTLERQSLPYALLGFTDCVGEESNNQQLRADRARAVAAALPKTARHASVIGAAPAGDYLLPGNATPAERALNRAVLLRLPFEELRQAAEIEKYSEHTIRFWQLNKTGAVDDLIRVVSAEAGALLDRNGVPRPKTSQARQQEKARWRSSGQRTGRSRWTSTR